MSNLSAAISRATAISASFVGKRGSGFAQSALRLALLYAMAMAMAGFVVLSFRATGAISDEVAWISGTVFGILVSFIAYRHGARLCDAVLRPFDRLASFGLVVPVAVFVLGGAVRSLWAVLIPVVPVSDGIVYLELARRLLDDRSYHIAGTFAYWPPGYPFFLTIWLGLFPSETSAILVSNLFLYAIGAWGVWKLARRVLPDRYALFSLTLYAAWPNLIFQSGLPEKELVLVAFLPWVMYFWIRALGLQHWAYAAIAGGVVFGGCCLVQPAVQLFPMFLVGSAVLAADRVYVVGRATLVFGLGVVLVIAPWTIRNYEVLGQFVLISTNGGDGLYRANNPLATGGYTVQGEQNLRPLGELDADREGKRLAKEWIIANPGAFVRLGFEKQIRFMGDDAAGAYHALKRDRNDRGTVVYALSKAACNAYWLAVCGLILCGLLHSSRREQRIGTEMLCLHAAFIYSFLLHSVAESAGKYHVLWISVLAVIAAGACVERARSSAASGCAAGGRNGLES